MKQSTVHRGVLLLLVLAISAIFFSMIKTFLMVILLAGIVSGLFRPVYRWFCRRFKGRAGLASFITVLLTLLLILIPLMGLLGVVTAQAVKVSRSVAPWVEQQINQPGALEQTFLNLPFGETILEYRDVILQRAGEILNSLSSLIINNLSSATVSTFQFIFLFFAFLYTLFFFQVDGHRLLNKILYYLPLNNEDEELMLEKFRSVTRATLKGTLVIGVIQGGLAGTAFAVVGISAALFWATLMTVLSIIPGIGTALIWVPAVIILAAGGNWAAAIGLGLWCAIVVGTVDNFLRPTLVGKDTKMHELLIFFSTIGGLTIFGVAGFVIGPIIAALFVTVWEIYGETFKDVLPRVNRPDPCKVSKGESK